MHLMICYNSFVLYEVDETYWLSKLRRSKNVAFLIRLSICLAYPQAGLTKMFQMALLLLMGNNCAKLF